jgi:ribosomal-protein-serine acetyltransferase
MKIDFKQEIKGERLTLKRTLPSIELSKTIFATVDENREYLSKWLGWLKFTNKVEDTFKYLVEKEKEEKAGKKVEYAMFDNDLYIGNIAIFRIKKESRSCEMGYWLSSKFAGKGYMSEAVNILEKEAFENLNMNRIELHIDTENIASEKVAKKNNYTYEGSLREYSYSEYF